MNYMPFPNSRKSGPRKAEVCVLSAVSQWARFSSLPFHGIEFASGYAVLGKRCQIVVYKAGFESQRLGEFAELAAYIPGARQSDSIDFGGGSRSP